MGIPLYEGIVNSLEQASQTKDGSLLCVSVQTLFCWLNFFVIEKSERTLGFSVIVNIVSLPFE